MRRIGVRELRQHASQWLREVKDGEQIEVTERGTVVALLSPAPEGNLDRLVAAGLVVPPGDASVLLEEPLDPIPGIPAPSQTLEHLREFER